jgi:hypothetical protein
MTSFQRLAVAHRGQPHVTVVAGVEMAGRTWTTTSAHAVKVAALRADPRAAVLDQVDGGWTLTAGPATVLDPRRPLDVAADPLAGALAGVALARIGLANHEQLVGYLSDAADIPRRWAPPSRVLLVVRAEHRLTWRDGRMVEATGRFAGTAAVAPGRRRRRRAGAPPGVELAALPRALVRRTGPCTVGLTTPLGPVVVPGRWHPRAVAVDVDRVVLEHLGAELPGGCCITLDDSDSNRPTGKVGVMLRGAATVAGRGGAASGGSPVVRLAIDVQRLTAWDGFATSTQVA